MNNENAVPYLALSASVESLRKKDFNLMRKKFRRARIKKVSEKPTLLRKSAVKTPQISNPLLSADIFPF